jgi:drug/metabolite transporter (DMT)-like permease
MLPAALSLTSSVFWGCSNFIAGVESRRRSLWTVTVISQAAAAISAAAVLLVVEEAPPGLVPTLWSVMSGVAGAIGLLAFYRALAIGPMSVVSPIMALQVIVPITAGLLEGERPPATAYAGMIVAVCGVALVAASKGHTGERVQRKTVVLALVTALFFGILLVGLGLGGRESPYWAVFDSRLASACFVVAWFVTSRRRLDMTARALPGVVLVGVLMTAAIALFTVATTIGYLSVVSVLGSLSPVVTTGLAHVVLGERLAPRQWIGFAAVFAGVVLLSV